MGLWRSENTASTISDEAYDEATWNGSLEAATKNAIRNKIETFIGGGDMLKSVYDTDNNSIVDAAEEVDGGAF